MILAVALFGLAACGGEDGAAPADEQRRLATRSACAAERLLAEAEEQQQMLTAAGVGGATVFADAFLQHAQLRYGAFAHADSALNFARAPGDSARYAAAADRFQIRAPEPGSVEANVFQSYEQRIAAILNDPDHPCNWRLDVEE